MSPQRSNRDALLEGALRCVETLPPERVTARAIADASGANLASIAYHFGSKDELVTEAVITGLDRWLAEVARRLEALDSDDPAARLRHGFEAIEATRREHEALARTFLAALARAQHDDRVRARLAAGFRRTRPAVAAVLGLGDDPADVDAAALVLALFDGLLFQALLDPELAIEGERMQRAQARLRDVLPRA
ncbi:MAG TPA: TetR/AcrR family transcriptional regulator [Solirubrobacteraceae bacterium]|nr:TetR/AcrR family transcriptional regulator [Solirubrobacteraceae bacterium]